MRKTFFLLCACSLSLFSAHGEATDSISAIYEQKLDELIASHETVIGNVSNQAEYVRLNPYFFRLMTPGTYYSQAVQQQMNIDWKAADTEEQKSYFTAGDAVSSSDKALASLYVKKPSLVSRIEASGTETPIMREELEAPITVEEPKLAEMAVNVDLDKEVVDTVTFVAKKPNFWKLSGNGSLQFTQSYFSDNWYQGGENNYAGIAMLTLEANYDNKQKIQWDNKLEAQLGFQTTSSDEFHKIRVTSNLLRITSKLGYKAAKNWFYTGQVMSNTQLAPYYEKNKEDWKARFATPLYLTVSIGMDYKFKSKNGKVELSVYMSPLAYYMTYISKFHSNHFAVDGNGDPALDANGYVQYRYWYTDTYGMENRDDHFLHKFGPNFTVTSKIQIMKNVTWNSRLYWFSNFHSTLFEWENTLDFTINKYLSAKFYAYPRFDDSSANYKKAHGYLMFKEWLSLGVSYKF